MEGRALRDGTREFCRRTLNDKEMKDDKGKFEMKPPPSLRIMKVGGNQSPQKGMSGGGQAFFLVSELRTFQFLSIIIS